MSIASKLVIIVVTVGVAITIVDYVSWRQAEFGRLGQGANVAQPPPPLALTRVYQSDWAGVRWSTPGEWKVNLIDVGQVGQRAEVAGIDGGPAQVTVWVEKYEGDLIGAAETETARLPTLVRERQYLNTDQVHAVILTWVEGDRIYQRALFTGGQKLVVVEAAAATSAWSAFEPTFWQVYRSVVLF